MSLGPSRRLSSRWSHRQNLDREVVARNHRKRAGAYRNHTEAKGDARDPPLGPADIALCLRKPLICHPQTLQSPASYTCAEKALRKQGALQGATLVGVDADPGQGRHRGRRRMGTRGRRTRIPRGWRGVASAPTARARCAPPSWPPWRVPASGLACGLRQGPTRHPARERSNRAVCGAAGRRERSGSRAPARSLNPSVCSLAQDCGACYTVQTRPFGGPGAFGTALSAHARAPPRTPSKRLAPVRARPTEQHQYERFACGPPTILRSMRAPVRQASRSRHASTANAC